MTTLKECVMFCPRKSVARASRELGMPKVTVWTVLRKRLFETLQDAIGAGPYTSSQ
jgi:hypothetical protein